MTVDIRDEPADSGLRWLLPRGGSMLDPIVPGPGHGAAVLARWQHEGLVRPLVDGVYLAAPWADVPVARCAALALLLRTAGAIGMASSVWARGGPGRRPVERRFGTERDGEGARDRDAHEVDLLLPAVAGRSRTREGVRTRRLRVRPDEVEDRHGVPLTRPVRTAVDLAMWGTGRDQDALDWLWCHGVATAAVRAELAGRRSNAWTVRALDVLARVDLADPSPLAAVPLTDPATVWAHGRDVFSPNASP